MSGQDARKSGEEGTLYIGVLAIGLIVGILLGIAVGVFVSPAAQPLRSSATNILATGRGWRKNDRLHCQ